jgi:hypothetical protein
MADVTDVSDRPDPAAARTPAEFVEAMRRLKRWTGFGFRQLEKRATAGGHALPRSTLTVALARDTVPREDLVAAFAHACGCDEDQTAGWVAARRRVAAAGVPDAPEPDQPTLEQPALTQPPPGRRRARRLVPALLALALALTAVTYLLSSSGRHEERQGADNNAAPPPDSSRARTPRQAPGSGTTTPEGEPGPTTPADPGAPGDLGGLLPIDPDTPGTSKQPGQPQPGPPPTGGTPPREPGPGPAPEESGRATIPVEGEPPIHCPMPFLNTDFGALAQCTQQSGGEARVGYYSPITQDFGPTIGWTEVTQDRWYEGSMLATDGVQAEVRGYAVVGTHYGPGVFATQYLDGKARWGTINLFTDRFYPSEQGWYDIAT